MFEGRKVVTVLPSYNVQDQIEKTVKNIPSFVDHIIVVDDCSQDETFNRVSAIDESRLIIIKNKKNLGVGGATIQGFRKGLELGGDIFVKFDGDGQMDPDRMHYLISPLVNGFDYAKANRFMHTKALNAMPPIRLIGNFVLTFLTKLASGYWKVFDPQNGYLAITREALQTLTLDSIYNRYFFENDMLINLNINKLRVVDVSMPAIYGDEKSSMKLSRIIASFPWLLLVGFFRRVYRKYVLADFSIIGFFYFMGIILISFGFFFGLYHWSISIFTGVAATTGTVMISVLPIILGFQLFLQGIVLEIEDK